MNGVFEIDDSNVADILPLLPHGSEDIAADLPSLIFLLVCRICLVWFQVYSIHRFSEPFYSSPKRSHHSPLTTHASDSRTFGLPDFTHCSRYSFLIKRINPAASFLICKAVLS